MSTDNDPNGKYLCQRCGNCCRWPGFVRMTAAELSRISAYLGLGVEEFANQFTDLLPGRDGLGIKSRPDGSCIFLEGQNVCSIQRVKPLHCQGFPNAWRFPGWRDVCEAIPVPMDDLAGGKRLEC